jgi:hypothetical protein
MNPETTAIICCAVLFFGVVCLSVMWLYDHTIKKIVIGSVVSDLFDLETKLQGIKDVPQSEAKALQWRIQETIRIVNDSDLNRAVYKSLLNRYDSLQRKPTESSEYLVLQEIEQQRVRLICRASAAHYPVFALILKGLNAQRRHAVLTRIYSSCFH